jgi:hypothetical protein
MHVSSRKTGVAAALFWAFASAAGCEQGSASQSGQGGSGTAPADSAPATGGSTGEGGAGGTGDGSSAVGTGGRGADDAMAGHGPETGRPEVGQEAVAVADSAPAGGGAAGLGAGGAAGAGGNYRDAGSDARGPREGGADTLVPPDLAAPTPDVAGDLPMATDTSGTSGILVPAQGALLGMYFGNGTMASTETKVGHKIAIHLVYYAWEDDWTRGTTKSDLDSGRIPLVNWEPAGIDFSAIVDGKLDATIDARASGAKALGRPFFLDFAAESNGDEAWSGNNAALYVSAYRRIHDRFVAAGATNVVWAWCPNVTDTDGSNKTTMAYYPGDDYVDWTGVDGYNWGGSEWQTFTQVFARIYPLLAAKGKPILIGEMASSATGGDKAAWIDAIVPALKSSYPLIKGLVWFDVNKEQDWRIDSSAESLAAFKRMAADAYLNP